FRDGALRSVRVITDVIDQNFHVLAKQALPGVAAANQKCRNRHQTNYMLRVRSHGSTVEVRFISFKSGISCEKSAQHSIATISAVCGRPFQRPPIESY